MVNIEDSIKKSLRFKQLSKLPKLKNSVLISGLPGIGNVGKVAVDFMVDTVNAKEAYRIYSKSFPHSVFVNEDNLIELPLVKIFYKKQKGKDLLFLVGDVHPINEESCYEFCDGVLDIAKKHRIKQIITMGGIGMAKEPNKPKVFCTGNDKKFIEDFRKKNKLSNQLYKTVGPIIGVSGLLVGLAKEHNIPAVCLLAETLNHPAYIGMRGAHELLKKLDNHLRLGINFKELDKEINAIEKEIMLPPEDIKKLDTGPSSESNYIG